MNISSVSVVIPAYNEHDGIAVVIEEVKDLLDAAINNSEIKSYEIIVVDDCSDDGTFDKAVHFQNSSDDDRVIRVLRHKTNKGYGASIMTGIKASSHDLIVTMDADGSYAAKDIRKLIPYIGDFDLVVGLRTGSEYKGTWLKYIARIFFRWLAEYISGEDIPDINSGMRIFKKSVFNSLPSVHVCRGFSFSTTMTLMYMAGGLDVKFEQIEYRQRKGKTKVRYLRDVLRALQILLEIAVYYNPIKAILPFALFPFLIGVGLVIGGIYADLFLVKSIWLTGAGLSFCFSVLIFCIGMILVTLRTATLKK